MLFAKEIFLRVPLSHYNNFNKTCEYLHNIQNENCYYDKSAGFKYIIKLFNDEFNDFPRYYWISEIQKYNSKMKKDYKLCISLTEYQYDEFIKKCNKLKLNKAIVLRSLMQKLIEETNIE